MIKLAETPTEKGIVTTGDALSTGVSSTLGRLGTAANIIAPVITPTTAFRNAYSSNDHGMDNLTSQSTDQRARIVRKVLNGMQKGNDGRLDDVAIRLGGGRYFADLGRTLTNPRTSLLGKALGAMTHPGTYGLTSALRSDHYDPHSNTVRVYTPNAAFLTHELGHALDFNRKLTKDEKSKGIFNPIQNIKNLPRDLYGLARGIPLPGTPVTLWQESAANLRSAKQIEKGFNQKAKDILHESRNGVLPAAFGSYVGNAVHPLAALPGVGVGLAAGLSQRKSKVSQNDLNTQLDSVL